MYLREVFKGMKTTLKNPNTVLHVNPNKQKRFSIAYKNDSKKCSNFFQLPVLVLLLYEGFLGFIKVFV